MENSKVLMNKPTIKRLSERAGIKSLSKEVYEDVRGLLRQFLEYVISKSIIIAQYRKHKTLERKDLVLALKVQNRYPQYKYLIAEADLSVKTTTSFKTCKLEKRKSRKTKAKPGSLAIHNIKYNQTHSDCLMFPKETFKNLIREIVTENISLEKLKIRKNYLFILQFVAEKLIVDVLRKAGMVVVQSKRVECMHKDFELTLKMLNLDSESLSV
jgi:histone H4